MKYPNFYIIGAGGLGKQVLNLIQKINADKLTFDFKSFVDLQIKEVKCKNKTYGVLHDDKFIEKIEKESEVNIAVATGFPEINYKIVQKYKSYNFNYPNIISPNAITNDLSFSDKKGNILLDGAILSVDSDLHDFNIFNLNVTIGHDVSIGSYNVFNPGANISGDCIVKDKILFGTNCTVIQGLSITDNCTISAAAFVSRDITEKVIAVGNPARIIRQK
jgi:sugar O-acyltransferase (sialic acid O-acetyltransferase NeuD family)